MSRPTIDGVARGLVKRLNLGDTDWHVVGDPGEPAFLNGWVNYGSFGDAAFRKDGMGFVHLQGLVKSGTTNSTCFFLPLGYRPRGRNTISGTPGKPTCIFQGLNGSNTAVARIDIFGSNGAVAFQGQGTNAWQTLAGICFYAGFGT